jgi:hypothetical protein
MLVANLTQKKLSDFEITDAIASHYPNYIQGALLAPVIQTMKKP